MKASASEGDSMSVAICCGVRQVDLLLLTIFKSILHRIVSQDMPGIHFGTNFQMPDREPATAAVQIGKTKHNAAAVAIHNCASKLEVMSAIIPDKRCKMQPKQVANEKMLLVSSDMSSPGFYLA